MWRSVALWSSMEQPDDSLPASELSKPDFFQVEKLTVLLMPAGYSWPASGLIGYDVARLHSLKQRTKKPITQLVRDAVNLLFELTPDETAATAIADVQQQPDVVEAPKSSKEIVAEYLRPVSKQTRARVQRTLFDKDSFLTDACAEDSSKEPREMDHRASAG